MVKKKYSLFLLQCHLGKGVSVFFVSFNLANSALFLPGLYSKNLATHLAF